jgi:hypothetical protein
VLILPSLPMEYRPPGVVNKGKGVVFLRNYDDWATCRPRSLGVGIRDIRECDVSPTPASSNKHIPFQGRRYFNCFKAACTVRNYREFARGYLLVTGVWSWKRLGARSLPFLRKRIDGNGKRSIFLKSLPESSSEFLPYSDPIEV